MNLKNVIDIVEVLKSAYDNSDQIVEAAGKAKKFADKKLTETYAPFQPAGYQVTYTRSIVSGRITKIVISSHEAIEINVSILDPAPPDKSWELRPWIKANKSKETFDKCTKIFFGTV